MTCFVGKLVILEGYNVKLAVTSMPTPRIVKKYDIGNSLFARFITKRGNRITLKNWKIVVSPLT